MRYIKIEFTSGLDGYAYQVIDESGSVTSYLDEKGDAVGFLDEADNVIVYEAKVIEDDTVPPFPIAVPEPVVAAEMSMEIMVVEEVVIEEQMPTTVSELEDKIRAIIAESK